jgi:ribosomal-protein-alanine N-acetyltransferase
MKNETDDIETARCRLRLVRAADRNDVLALYRNEDVRRYLGGVVDERIIGHRFDQMLDSSKARNWTVYRKEDGAFIGLVTLGRHHDEQEPEISYQYLPSFWGQGLAREALDALLRFASDVLGLAQVLAETQSKNLPSRRLLERLGMVPVRTLIRFGEEQIIYRRAI